MTPEKQNDLTPTSDPALASASGSSAGRKMSPETKAKISAANRGRKKPPGFGEKVRARFAGKKLTPEHAAKNRAHGFRTPTNPYTPEIDAKIRRAISMARKGTHGYGQAARDNPKHFHALHWIIRSPAGAIYEFDNAASWARSNEHLFLPDEYPDARLPLWRRFTHGLNNMQRTDKKASHSWRGWTIVSVVELKQIGAPDLLARDKHSNGPDQRLRP